MAKRKTVREVTEIRGLRTFLDRRRGTSGRPAAAPTMPNCPEHLDAFAKVEFANLSKILIERNTLSEQDVMSLANLCQAWSNLVKAQSKLSETGLLIKAPSGYVQQNPLIPIVNSWTDIVTRLSIEFGLTPKSRNMLPVEP